MAVAARDAGFGVVESRSPGKLISPEELRRQFQEIAIRKGLTLERIADKIADHLDARANQTLNGKEVTQSAAPDNRVQQKAIEQLTTLIGLTDATKQSTTQSAITLSISGPLAERLVGQLTRNGGEE